MSTTAEERADSRKHKCSRTNILLDDRLIEQARELTGLQTKRDIVEEALRLLVQIRRQEGVRRLRGKLHWEGDLDAMRQGRFLDARD
ncbi:MAG: type II toxin-antitoxin system VapB family antitoxin [Armatimonadetes bacterium]|nr:type II toxin-antitoxin system VapB family antitoxin [Armatimonadota bacterium]